MLDGTIGEEFALVGATEGVCGMNLLTETLAAEAGINVTRLDFINTAVMEAGVNSAARLRYCGAAAQQFQALGGETQVLANKRETQQNKPMRFRGGSG